MQQNFLLNMTRLEHESKIEELEKTNAKILEKIQKVHVAKNLFELRSGVNQSLNYPIHSNSSKYFLVKKK